MKKIVLPLALLTFAITSVNAQETENTKPTANYDRWSIELNGGVNKPTRAMTPGYYTSTISPFHADLGVRYMFNPKFGLKLDFGYDELKDHDDSAPFKSTYLRTSLQGVVNLGRVMNFEEWTNTFGLLAHGGFGVSQLSTDNGFDGEDYMGHGILGLTGQLRVSNSIALTADLTGIVNGKQNNNFDGQSRTTTGAFDGVLLNASVGLTFYLGKHEKHADWYSEQKSLEIEALDKRVGDIETMMNDSDKDGVPDYLDVEPNTITGVAVDTKGRTIDRNNNGVPDELESYLEKTYGKKGETNNMTNNQLVKDLINGGYVTTYFDFNKTQPTNVSTQGIDFILTYLRNNPSASVEIYGNADEIGATKYNYNLANKRAENVKAVLVKAGIPASRLNVISKGEDTSVDKDSAAARKLVRRVTFMVK